MQSFCSRTPVTVWAPPPPGTPRFGFITDIGFLPPLGAKVFMKKTLFLMFCDGQTYGVDGVSLECFIFGGGVSLVGFFSGEGALDLFFLFCVSGGFLPPLGENFGFELSR